MRKPATIYRTLGVSLFVLSFNIISSGLYAQLTAQSKTHTRQDTLRGSINEDRSWWDVKHYAVSVTPDYNSKRISGNVVMSFAVLKAGTRMQIDLQQPMELLSATWNGQRLPMEREGNVAYLKFPSVPAMGTLQELNLEYAGGPRVAKNPPWDGGWIFVKDKAGNPWMSVACQGLGASVWFPCKDHQSDEPDSATLSITVPDTLTAVGNGRLREKKLAGEGKITWTWAVTNPINSYNIIPYIGKYVNWIENYAGEKGNLDCSYWVLDYNLEKAKVQFAQAPLMLKCFEYWFGPYPFYEDGFKLVESPHLGMEHQSAVAYGNGYQNGYRGRDLSGSGYGLKWDFIIIHESGHEWFGNNITSNDIADMWLHEGFTNYSETIYTQCQSGKEAGLAYVSGTRALIRNQSPIIGPYGVNEEGSGDMYYKGGNLIHYFRQFFKDDEAFRQALREMSSTWYHKTANTDDIEKFWSKKAGRDLSKLFDQYLRHILIPKLEYSIKGKTLSYRWTDCIPGYDVPVKISINGGESQWIYPGTASKDLKLKSNIESVKVDPNFYVREEQVPAVNSKVKSGTLN